MDEIEYIKSIDACFPYEDEKAWRAVIDEGVAISDNAAYMALHAICAYSSSMRRSDLDRMLEYWSSQYDHPTKTIVLRAAKAAIQGISLPEEDILKDLDEIAEHPGLYNALGIVCNAAPGDNSAAEAVERRCNEIYRRWEEMLGREEDDVTLHKPTG